MARSKLLPKNNQKEYSSICTATKATPDASTVRIANECFYAYENNSPKKRKFLRHSFPEIRLFFHASGSAGCSAPVVVVENKKVLLCVFLLWMEPLPHTVDSRIQQRTISSNNRQSAEKVGTHPEMGKKFRLKYSELLTVRTLLGWMPQACYRRCALGAPNPQTPTFFSFGVRRSRRRLLGCQAVASLQQTKCWFHNVGYVGNFGLLKHVVSTETERQSLLFCPCSFHHYYTDGRK